MAEEGQAEQAETGARRRGPARLVPWAGERPSRIVRIAPLLLAGVALWSVVWVLIGLVQSREAALLKRADIARIPASRAAILRNLHRLHQLSVVEALVFWPVFVAGMYWAYQRRRGKRLGSDPMRQGPSYLSSAPVLTLLYWALLVAVVVGSLATRPPQAPATVAQLVHFRREKVVTALLRVAWGAVVFGVVWRVTSVQRRREALPPPELSAPTVPADPADPAAARTGIEVIRMARGKPARLNLPFAIDVDGWPATQAPGTTFVPLAPGQHRVTVLMGRKKPTAVVDVPDGVVVVLHADLGTWIWSPATLSPAP